jgi:flagellar basal body-associated protein FliL
MSTGESDAKRSSKVQMGLLIVAAVGLLVTGGGGYFAYRSWQSKSWPTAEGQIIESRVEREKSVGDSIDEQQYKAVVRYNFTVEGAEYTCDRVAFGVGTSNHRSDAKKIINEYPVRRTVTVHYSPEDPNDAVLDAGMGGFAIIILIVGPIILLIGVVGFIAEFRGKVSAILDKASDEQIGGDDGTAFGFDE